MINLTTMTIQLIDGEADGIRICRVEGESLITIVIPKDELAKATQLPQLPQRGIYYLLDEDHGVLSRVYAGQTIQGISRLKAHKSKKEFWNKAVMFLDEDWNIDRDVLDSLEAKAICYLQVHGSYETDNEQIPNPRLSPYKEQRVESLLNNILFRMEVLGYDLNRSETAVVSSDSVFHTKKNAMNAQGRYDQNSGCFTVLAGSDVDLGRPIIKSAIARECRKRLFGEANHREKLQEDVTFSSPSAAAVFVLGGSQNGWTEWVNERGQTLDDVYRNRE